MRFSVFFSLSLCFSFIHSSETPKETTPTAATLPGDELCETTHEITIKGKTVPYKATIGSLLVKDPKSDATGNIFFTSYTKISPDRQENRPVTFCFNGGPGSSSVWLHMEFAGPKRVYLPSPLTPPMPPYKVVENEFSLLDITDLVFIDPISTGFSRAVPPEDEKKFYDSKTDIVSISKFVSSYLTRFKRWDSAKFLMGESYGTMRAAGLANYLHEEELINLNGIILISSVLNYGSLKSDMGNDLPYFVSLPTYTASAWYHKKLNPELMDNFEKAIETAKNFVRNEYVPALFKGDLLPKAEKEKLAAKMATLTGLSFDYILKSDLRVDIVRFAKQLLSGENKEIGRFDSQVTGSSLDNVTDCLTYDPSMESTAGAFTAAFNGYIERDLGWKKDTTYTILSDAICFWSFEPRNQYLNYSEELRNVMTKNPYLHVFVASGYFDLATPFFGTEYTFDHLNLSPSVKNHVTMENYPGGHMMYTDIANLKKLKDDTALFYEKSLTPPAAEIKR